jgi:hypothetical protein
MTTLVQRVSGRSIPIVKLTVLFFIYRDDENNANNLYIANHAGAEPADREGRYDIRLTHVQYIGATSVNWVEFAEGGQNPIRYLP